MPCATSKIHTSVPVGTGEVVEGAGSVVRVLVAPVRDRLEDLADPFGTDPGFNRTTDHGQSLGVNGGTAVGPRTGLFELGGELDQQVLTAGGGHQLDADREPVGRVMERY